MISYIVNIVCQDCLINKNVRRNACLPLISCSSIFLLTLLPTWTVYLIFSIIHLSACQHWLEEQVWEQVEANAELSYVSVILVMIYFPSSVWVFLLPYIFVPCGSLDRSFNELSLHINMCIWYFKRSAAN